VIRAWVLRMASRVWLGALGARRCLVRSWVIAKARSALWKARSPSLIALERGRGDGLGCVGLGRALGRPREGSDRACAGVQFCGLMVFASVLSRLARPGSQWRRARSASPSRLMAGSGFGTKDGAAGRARSTHQTS